jgi:hypothetical protein
MKNRLLTIIGVSAAFAVLGQSPEIEAWMLNTNGDMAHYEFYPGPPPTTSAVQLTDSSDVKTVCYNATNVYVRANGLASYTMGPWPQNPNVPSSQEWVFKIPRNPIEATGTNTNTPFGGAQAVSINGVVMFGYGDGKSYSSAQGANVGNGDGNWDTDAWVSEGSTMDASGGGHPTNGGLYHYHATPFTLYVDPGTGHSAIIGYAFDGFPIYGPFGYTNATNSASGVTRMVSSYQLRTITDRTILPDASVSTPPGPSVSASFPLGTYVQDYEYVMGSGSLDEYNGRYCYTPEYPTGTYAYFLSTDNSGDPQFPYILAGSYYGVVSQPDIQNAGNSISPGGLTCYTGPPNSIEEELTEGVSIYPNPANSFVKIISESIPQKIIIVSLDGKVIESLNPSSLKTELSISNYPSGIYLVRILNNNAVTFKSLVITE